MFIRQPTQRRGRDRARRQSSAEGPRHRPRRHLLRGAAGDNGSRTVWLFDHDNTLHDASHAIVPAINRLMTAYVARVLGSDEATASRVRVEYWQRYGATLLGMIRHHQVDPADFLRAAQAACGDGAIECFEARLRRWGGCRGARSWSPTRRATTRWP